MTNVISMVDWRKKQPQMNETSTELDDYEVDCSFTLEETGETFSFDFSQAEYPLPVAELTLFGWSVSIWDFHQQQWLTLPDWFETETEAYDQAELIMKSIDEGSKND